jgi:P2-related tail formation protein
MQKIQNSNLYDILPASFQTVETKCIAFALSRAIAFLCEAADKTQLTANIEQLDEKALDYLALEYRTQYYDQQLPREQKIELIKGSLQWYMYAGTKKALKDMIRALFLNSVVKEWHEYGGEPYHFKVEVISEGYEPGDYDKLYEVIDTAKNARSILDEISLSYDHNVICSLREKLTSSTSIENYISTAGERTEQVVNTTAVAVMSSTSIENIIQAIFRIVDCGDFTEHNEDIIDGGDFSVSAYDILDFNY